MSALFNTLKQQSQSLKLSKNSKTHSYIGSKQLFSTKNRLFNWLLCQNCFDLTSYTNFITKLQDQFKNFHSEVQSSLDQLSEKENEEWDDPLACNTVISFEMETKHQINVDLERTEYFVSSMNNDQCKQFCFKILLRWALSNQKLGYRQGMNEVLSILMKVVFEFFDSKNTSEETSKKDDVLDINTSNDNEQTQDYIFDKVKLEFDENEKEIENILKDKLFLCGLLFNCLLSNGIQQFYKFESKGVKKMDLFLHQTVHKIFKKRLKVSLFLYIIILIRLWMKNSGKN